MKRRRRKKEASHAGNRYPPQSHSRNTRGRTMAWNWMRERMDRMQATVPNVGMAGIIDSGIQSDIHPSLQFPLRRATLTPLTGFS